VALGQSDATSLAGGALASSIQPSKLGTYCKICGTASPEPDQQGGGNAYTLVGTPAQIAHPPAVAASCGSGSGALNVLQRAKLYETRVVHGL
jgi:hypothetical protein